MNKQFLFIAISFVVLSLILVLSYVEMYNCKHKAIITIDTRELQKTKSVTISPTTAAIKHNIYVYANDSSHTQAKHHGYVCEDIYEHIASSIITPVTDTLHKLKQAHNSYAPINTMYGAISNATDVISIVSLSTIPDIKYTLEHHADDNVTAFLSNGIIYIL